MPPHNFNKMIMPKFKIKSFVVSQLVIIACSNVLSAAELSAVPMQGGMVMPMVRYDGALSHLRVMVDPAIPELTPLLVSNPTDNFNPADPWFDALSPSRESRSFSRRYGFVMDTMSDPLPAGVQIWIRKLFSSEGLSAYRYANTEPKAFEPIFGTDGATNAMHWNGMMFHPTFTAPAGTNAHTAVFEAFLLNVDTGMEIPESGTGPFTFEWTNVPDGRPEIEFAGGDTLTWPGASTNYVPEFSDGLNPAVWNAVTNTPVAVADRLTVPVQPGAPQKFYRLRLVQ
jgi:hypothetical protein